jgi:TIR domain
MADVNFKYDVTLSFAGEDRVFVDCVAEQLKLKGLKLFYDKYEQINLWGKDLYTHLDDVYANKARYCVMFISNAYAKKLWTNHERESAQARAFRNSTEYILPFRLDDTLIPGVRETTGYLSIKDYDCNQLAQAIIEKVNESKDAIPDSINIDIIEGDETEELTGYGISKLENGQYEIKIRKYEFFSSRLNQAFPGVRGLKWFYEPKEIIERLRILFSKPLSFEVYPNKDMLIGGISTPIWWFRGGSSMPIKRFRVLSQTRCLINDDEFEVDKIAVYRSMRLYKEFIYLKIRGAAPLNSSETTDSEIARQVNILKYATENYAIYKGKVISAEEYEDGAMFRNGKLIQFEERPTYRRRFLSPYNIIICAQSSIYNSREADVYFADALKELLLSDEKLEEVISVVTDMENDSPQRIDFF